MSDTVPVVHDLNHNNVVNIHRAAANGIVGIIHKATQGVSFIDSKYPSRREIADDAEVCWGAYHFCSGDSPRAQVEFFFNAAKPDDKTVMCLDYEDNVHSQMSLEQAVEFLTIGDEKLGRPIDIYSGNRIKEMIRGASAETRALFGKRRLWLAQYGSKARLLDYDGKPLPWDHYWLWQRWADGAGTKPIPHVAGLQDDADLSVFMDTPDVLKATWVGVTS